VNAIFAQFSTQIWPFSCLIPDANAVIRTTSCAESVSALVHRVQVQVHSGFYMQRHVVDDDIYGNKQSEKRMDEHKGHGPHFT